MEHLDACARAQVGARETLSERSFEGPGGGGHQAPAVHPSLPSPALSASPAQSRLLRLRARVDKSVWAPVALKLAGMTLGMLVLAGIGIGSLWLGGPGVKVPLAKLLGGNAHSAWLASKPEAEPAASVATPATAPNAPSTQSTPSNTPVTDTIVAVTPESPADAASPPAPSGISSDGKVILNQASVEELMKLPGVGRKRATAIVALRAKLGGHFKRPTDLLRVKGIGVRGLKKMLPHLLLDAPTESTVHAAITDEGSRETAAG